MVRDPEDAKLPLLAGQKSINTTRDVIIVTLCHRIYSRGKEMICGIFNAAAGKASGWWDWALPGSALSSRGQKWEKIKKNFKKGGKNVTGLAGDTKPFQEHHPKVTQHRVLAGEKWEKAQRRIILIL